MAAAFGRISRQPSTIILPNFVTGACCRQRDGFLQLRTCCGIAKPAVLPLLHQDPAHNFPRISNRQQERSHLLQLPMRRQYHRRPCDPDPRLARRHFYIQKMHVWLKTQKLPQSSLHLSMALTNWEVRTTYQICASSAWTQSHRLSSNLACTLWPAATVLQELLPGPTIALCAAASYQQLRCCEGPLPQHCIVDFLPVELGLAEPT